MRARVLSAGPIDLCACAAEHVDYVGRGDPEGDGGGRGYLIQLEQEVLFSILVDLLSEGEVLFKGYTTCLIE